MLQQIKTLRGMSSDPTKEAKEYLTKQGFPFEMKVATLFQKAGFRIHQSAYYIDPITDVPREIDVIAIWIAKFGSRKINIVFPIECKYAVSPWIFFSSITEGFPLCYLPNRKGFGWIKHLTKQKGWGNFFEVDKNIGYGLTVTNAKTDDINSTNTKKDNSARKDGKESSSVTRNNAYAAIQTLLNFLKSEHKEYRFAHPNDFVIYVPILAIKGPLVEAKLDSNHEIDCREINEGQIYYKEDIFDIIPKIHVVTEAKLEEYIAKLKEDCERLSSVPYMTDELVKSASPPPTSGRNTPSKHAY
jgi:hypothetical protein